MRLFASLSKVEDQPDGTIRVFGVASSGSRDEAGEIILPEAMKAAIPDYMAFGAVREMHQPKAAGTALECSVDADGLTQFGAHVVDPVAVQKVKAGVYKGFSIGGKVLARDPDDRTTITKIKLSEISLVDRPCNNDATLNLWKADIADPEGDPMSDAYQPSNDEVKAQAAELAKAAGKPDRANDFLVKAREGLVEKAAAEAEFKKMAPVLRTEIQRQRPEMDEASLDKAVEIARSVDGEALTVEQIVSKALEVLPAAEGAEAAPAEEVQKVDPVAAVQEALERAAKAGKEEADGPFADPKNKKYPLDTAAHIRAAWAYINVPKNQKDYTSEEVQAIKDKIVAAWKAKIDADGPPSAEKMAVFGDLEKAGKALGLIAKSFPAEDARLAKGLYTLARVAHKLEGMGYIAQSVFMEENAENDKDSKLPQMAADIVASLHAFLVEMADEEVSELLASLKSGAPDLDVNICPPNEDCTVEVVELATSILDLSKADEVALAKAGRRNSASDQSMIQASHDHMAKLGAKCDPSNCPEVDADKVAKAALTAENERLSKGLLDTVPAIEALQKRLDTQAEEIRLLKAQPMPPKTAGSSHAIGKSEDFAGAVEKTAPDADDLKKWLDGLSPEERAFELTKASLARPISIGR